MICFDTNVILDAILRRAPHLQNATKLVYAVEEGKLTGQLGATTVTTVYYIVQREYTAEEARRDVRDLLQTFNVAPVQRRVLENAAASDFSDFEDAVLHEAALESGADGIVTRNTDDFASATLSIYTPHELVRALNESL